MKLKLEWCDVKVGSFYVCGKFWYDEKVERYDEKVESLKKKFEIKQGPDERRSA